MIDILSDEYVAAANEELKNKPCPLCLHFGSGSVEVRFSTTENFSLAGVQDKVSVVGYLHYTCSACKQEGRLSQ